MPLFPRLPREEDDYEDRYYTDLLVYRSESTPDPNDPAALSPDPDDHEPSRCACCGTLMPQRTRYCDLCADS